MKRVHLIVALMVLTGFGILSIPTMAQANKATASAPQKQKPARNLAILIFDGVQIIDYTGPYETFGHAYSKDGPVFNIYTVSEKATSITTAMGMTVTPKYSFENAPPPSVLVVPGGGVEKHVANANVIKWIQEKARDAEVVMSVCNGAFFLAKAGLLDGLEATTTAGLIPRLREAAPKTKVVEDRRFVDNGKIITTAGLSSGIDGSLHVIERFLGRGTAQIAALGMEYNWDPESKYVRAALADKYLRFDYDVKVLEGGWRPLGRNGDSDHWENTWSVTTNTSAAELFESVNNSIADNKTYGEPSKIRWTRLPVQPTKVGLQSLWQFTDEKGSVWKGIVSVEPIAGEPNRFTLSVKIARPNTKTLAGG
ncbi:MAG: DJ-1/PfpI family protein [Pyrinomonadaceae bacterium]|nr:DJ-1/PfpI family protein [Pyrinomonadaceae bacterium]